jgi:hypothetical protein
MGAYFTHMPHLFQDFRKVYLQVQRDKLKNHKSQSQCLSESSKHQFGIWSPVNSKMFSEKKIYLPPLPLFIEERSEESIPVRKSLSLLEFEETEEKIMSGSEASFDTFANISNQSLLKHDNDYFEEELCETILWPTKKSNKSLYSAKSGMSLPEEPEMNGDFNKVEVGNTTVLKGHFMLKKDDEIDENSFGLLFEYKFSLQHKKDSYQNLGKVQMKDFLKTMGESIGESFEVGTAEMSWMFEYLQLFINKCYG